MKRILLAAASTKKEDQSQCACFRGASVQQSYRLPLGDHIEIFDWRDGRQSVDKERDGVTWRNRRCGNQGRESRVLAINGAMEKHLCTPFFDIFSGKSELKRPIPSIIYTVGTSF